ncbi:MAG: hypothetical protein ABJB05_13605, partial [Parafilimonas sp.]
TTLKTICQDLISQQDALNELDTQCGDGDCGYSLAQLSAKILSSLDKGDFNFDYISAVLMRCSLILEERLSFPPTA